MNTLTNEKRCAVIKCMVDGCSIRATTCITGVAKNTIQKLTRELGEAAAQYSDNVIRNIKAQRVQCDEIWCFCYAREKNLPDSAMKAGISNHKWSIEEMVDLLPEASHPNRD